MSRTQIRVPASTSNLGASFDTCGLALGLYLNVTVEPGGDRFEIELKGEVEGRVPNGDNNLIPQVARHVSTLRGREITGARLSIDSEIPLARGLGSSSSAIIAGISVYEILSGDRLKTEELFEYALEFEGHGDNLAPSTLGGLVVACVVERGPSKSLAAIKRSWPEEIKLVLAIPDFEMNTREMRDALPTSVPMADAVFNLQRGALLQAVMSEQRFDLLSEALRDRLHQPYRLPLVPGLASVLRMNEETALIPGLLGVALSGAGSTMIAFASGEFESIAREMEDRLRNEHVTARTIRVEVDNVGRQLFSV
jgi:homoserine kinase